MRTTAFIVGFTLVTNGLFGQATPIIPFDEISTYSGPLIVNGPFEIFAPYQGMGPVVVYNTAQVDFVAGERVHLQPGFEAGNFSGNGYFHAQIGAAPDFDVVFIEPNVGYPQVGLNNKLELGLRLPAALESQVQNFINGSGGINPFDEQQIIVKATFANSLSIITIDGFYYEEFSRDGNVMSPEISYNWLPQPTAYNWRLRFAPPFLGTWRAKIEIFLGNSPVPISTVDGIEFGCIPSSNPGYLRVGSDNRHLKFSSTGGSFFAIGQNIAWADGSWFRGTTFSVTPYGRTGGILDISDWITSLADNGGNFVRFIVTPQFGEIEWGALGNYASVNTTQNPIASNTGLAQAWELDQMFALCESKNVYMMFDVSFQGAYIAGSSSPWYGWENNPYNLEIGNVSQPTDLYRDPVVYNEVMRNLKNKYRYYLSRWGYSTSLGVFELFSEFENWDGNDGITENNNANDGIRSDAYAFLEDLALAIKSTDLGSNHLLSISISNTPWNDVHNPSDHVFNSPLVDVTSWHGYHKERTASHTYFTECNSSIGHGMLSDWDKPTIVSEMGIYHDSETVEGVPIADEGDISSCSDILFHNYLWSTAFSGGYGTGLNWWQWFNDDYRESNFPAIATFFSIIDFEENSYVDPGRWDDGAFPFSDNSLLETVYLKSESNDHAIGWAHNMSYWWGNIDQDCQDRYGRVMPIRPADPLEGTYGDVDDVWSTPQVTFIKPKIEGLNIGQYAIHAFSTRGVGGPIGNPIGSQWTDIFGRLELPDLGNLGGGVSDYAFKVDIDPLIGMRISNVIELDTLKLCAGDSIVLQFNTSFEDYNWFLDGNEFEQTAIVFDHADAINIELQIVDSMGQIKIFTQVIVVEECHGSITSRFGVNIDPIVENGVSLYPNPTISSVFIETMNSSEALIEIEIYDLSGNFIDAQVCEFSNGFLYDVSFLSSGSYLFIIETSRKKYYERLVKAD